MDQASKILDPNSESAEAFLQFIMQTFISGVICCLQAYAKMPNPDDIIRVIVSDF